MNGMNDCQKFESGHNPSIRKKDKAGSELPKEEKTDAVILHEFLFSSL